MIQMFNFDKKIKDMVSTEGPSISTYQPKNMMKQKENRKEVK